MHSFEVHSNESACKKRSVLGSNKYVAKYLDTATVKVSTKFHKTTLPADIIFTKEDVSTRDEQVEKLTR